MTFGTFRHGGHVARRPAPPALVDALIDAAGLTGPWTVESVATVGWVNRHTTIRLGAGGDRFVVRQYGWPFDDPEPFDRRAKEQWLHPALAAAGVPVPAVLAVADRDGDRAALLSHVPGTLLGTVAARTDPAAMAPAWAEAGAALRAAHDLAGVVVGTGPDGLVGVAGRVEPLAGGTAGAWAATRSVRFSERLATHAPDLPVDPHRIAGMADAVAGAIDAGPRVLGHGDPQAWNVLVAEGTDGRWHLSGWLDWEFAWHVPPALDHVRMLVQRYADFGPVPPAWWQGYGATPDPPAVAAATLHFMLWKALDVLDGVDSRDGSVATAWLADLPAHLDRLDALL